MRIYVNDMGVLSALGNGKADVLANLLAGRTSGVRRHDALFSGRSTWVGTIDAALPRLPEHLAELDCRNNRLLAAALDQMRETIQDLRDSVGADRIAVIIGTSTSGIAEGESAIEALSASGAFPPEFDYRQQEIGTAALFVARYLGITGPSYTISTACSSSAKVFGSARRLIASGQCDAAIVGGSDSLCRLTLNGFDALGLLSPDICDPFSANRRGINIGEAACVFALSTEPAAVELLGVGESSDGYHMSAPDPEGKGAELAVGAALGAAGLDPAAVDYVNLHGTGTRKNDEMESHLIARVFGTRTPCSSTKSQTGHTLGAAGALEAGLCWLLLSDANPHRRLPAQVWDGENDPGLPRIALLGEQGSWSRGVFMSNSFAFGGSNASLILGRRA